ncbi:DUF58 domain-containing protein [Paraliobacillus salinarum]|uniref:DUF58 domain-containing protein n=1 Tax=Paraliobacillus salinarum TaxID=1158996 RepID=UPI0015F3D7F4|nr:DUF58 domain-containing protein [Paraliobacillus salinarum]
MNSFHLISRLLQLVVLFGILFSYAMFQGGFVSWFLLYAFIPLFLYFILFMLYPISKWNITRTLSHTVQHAGGKIEVTIEISRRIGFPLPFIIIEDCFEPSLKHDYYSKEIYQFLNQPNEIQCTRVKKKIHFPLFKRKISYTYVLEELPRGFHQLQTTRIKTSDFFGLVHKQHLFPVKSSFIVYPQTRKLVMKQSRNKLEEGATSTVKAHTPLSYAVNGVREYMPGDKFSWIDWKTTARKQEMITREFEQEKNVEQLLILDATSYQGINPIAFEANVELVSSFLEWYHGKNTNLSLLSIGKQTNYFSFIESSNKQAISQHLATVQPEEGSIFSEQLRKNLNTLPAYFNVHVFVSTLTEERMETIGQLAKKMNHAIVYLTKGSALLTEEDRTYIEQCKYLGVTIHVITEQQWMQSSIEVGVS